MSRRSFQPVRLAAALAVLVGGILGTASAAHAAAPSNDNFANATVISGPLIFNEFASTAGATRQTGEQTPAGVSIWYRWTAPADVKVSSHSSLTLLDSLELPRHSLTFYTGSRLAGLTQVDTAFGQEPTVAFTATAGTVYQVAINVPTQFATRGNTHLFLDASPVNDDLAAATTVSGASGSAQGSVENSTWAIGDEPQHSLQSAAGGSVWFDWTAPSTGFTRFGVECCAGFGTQPVMAVYTGPSMAGLKAVSSSYGCTVGAFNTCTTFHHVKGTTYHVAVQGNGSTFPLKWAPVASGCTITGTAAADSLTGTPGADLICGLGGNDTIKGLAGDDVIVGGPGTDTVDYTGAPGAVTADLSAAAAFGDDVDSLQEVENLLGSPFADRLVGNRGPNSLRGGLGRDQLVGDAGADSLSGDGGNDVLSPGAGLDSADGGAGIDEVNYGDARAVTVDLGVGRTEGADGTDTLRGLENVVGSEVGDLIIGDGLANELVGGEGNDILEGRAGDDRLYSWWGNDTMLGGVGNDFCDGGGHGTDKLDSCETFRP